MVQLLIQHTSDDATSIGGDRLEDALVVWAFRLDRPYMVMLHCSKLQTPFKFDNHYRVVVTNHRSCSTVANPIILIHDERGSTSTAVCAAREDDSTSGLLRILPVSFFLYFKTA